MRLLGLPECDFVNLTCTKVLLENLQQLFKLQIGDYISMTENIRR